MIPLQNQEHFEALLKPSKLNIIVYFTAPWCGACSRLNLQYLQDVNKDIVWYKCDVDENKYTLGYCGLTKIPSFVFIKDGKFLGKFTSSDTFLVEGMIKDIFLDDE